MLPSGGFYFIMTIAIFFLIVFGVSIAVSVFIILLRHDRRLNNIEKQLFPYLKKLDDKNYSLWKAKLKAEEALKKLDKKYATI